MGLLSLADTLDRRGFRVEVRHLGVDRLASPESDPVEALETAGAQVIGTYVPGGPDEPDDGTVEISGTLNINPNNNPHREFTMQLPDGSTITRDDLHAN